VDATSRLRSLYVEPVSAPEYAEPPALELIDVFKIFRSGPTETVALRGLDLQVRPREMVAVVGPSGSGKSTMLAVASAMDVPSAGEVRVGGRSLARMSEPELARLRAEEIGVVFQSRNLWPTLSALENVAASTRLAGRPDADMRSREALARFGLDRRAGNTPDRISGGEQQRVAIAAAAARGPQIVLADEPTGELDAENESVVLEALRRLSDDYETSVVLVTHSASVADACAPAASVTVNGTLIVLPPASIGVETDTVEPSRATPESVAPTANVSVSPVASSGALTNGRRLTEPVVPASTSAVPSVATGGRLAGASTSTVTGADTT
jgi:putative ABC transport system ATP-binding protein